ncbi:hypothetical protein RRG08_007885 [Elysia crispata]|uniref:Uncharacterized protein n=1 Tax=Elysia crispata TaxID=231223 RepID=A0AAE1CNJ8_9GAST|nr:hypothetical protein RRG08_007885 [Elysia crispata]
MKVIFTTILPFICQFRLRGVRQVYLKQTTGQECQTLQIGESWSSWSALECAFRFSDTCQSIVYNAENQTCTPDSVAFGPLQNVDTSIPVTGFNGKIVYMKQPIPPCTVNGNFALYDVCGTTACLPKTTVLKHFHFIGE